MNNRLEETPQIDDTDIILEVHKISKRFGGIKALNNIDFSHLAKVKSCLTERNIAD